MHEFLAFTWYQWETIVTPQLISVYVALAQLSLNYRIHMEGGLGGRLVRMGSSTKSQRQGFPDSKVCDEHTIKVVNRKRL